MTEYYEIQKDDKPQLRAGAKLAKKFHEMEVGDSFMVPPEDFSRASSARSHYQKKYSTPERKIRFSSRMIKDENGKVIGNVFRREE